MKKLKQRLLVISLAIIIVIVVFESILRLVYWGNYYLHKQQVHLDHKKETILCVGNSFTFGAGAPAGQSYPDHLQRLLGDSSYQVINLGRGAFNTSLISEHLEAWLSTYHPRYVLFQVGEPNVWNPYGYERFIGIDASPVRSFLQKYSATYRFFYYLLRFHDLEDSPNDDFAFSKETPLFHERGSRYETLRNFALDCLTSDWEYEARRNLKQTDEYKNRELLQAEALKLYEAHPQIPATSMLLYQIQLSCGNNFSASLPYLKNLIRLEPEKEFLHLMNTWRTLRSTNYQDSSKANDLKLFFSYVKNEHPRYYDFIYTRPTFRLEDWIVSDLKKMIDMTKKAGAQAIILNYPPRPNNTPREIDSILRTFAQEENISFIEIEKYFKSIWQSSNLKKEDLHEVRVGVPTEHLNGEGYQLLAQEVFRRMNELRLLRPKS